MSGAEIVHEIEAAGGVLALNGDKIRYDIPKAAGALLEAVRVHRGEVLEVLWQRQERAREHVSRWMGMRCTQSPQAWGAEKFLYRDFAAWCQQQNEAPDSRGLFSAILDESLERDGNGWRGVCLAPDFAASSAGAITQDNGIRFPE
jgi:hypothetical protein